MTAPAKIALPHVIAVVIRDGHSTQAELAQINPIAVEYQAALKAGTQVEVAKPLLARLMMVVGKDRVRNALAHLKAIAEGQATGAQAHEPAAPTPAQPGSKPGRSSACGQKHGLEPSAQPNSKRARADEASALVAAAPPAQPEGAGTRGAQKRARAADGVDGGGGLLADVNLDDEQARLLAPRPAHATRSQSLPPVAPAAAAAADSAGARGAQLARWLGGALAADGLGPADGPAQIVELVELLDGALRQRMRQLLCGVCDASQRRRETAASEAGLVRSNAPLAAGGGTALVPAGGAGTGLAGAPSLATGAASVTLRERVQIRDALHYLESERRSSKSPVLAWWRAVGSARNRFPRHVLSARPVEREAGGSGAAGEERPAAGDADDAAVPPLAA